jgi:hypothetical protein
MGWKINMNGQVSVSKKVTMTYLKLQLRDSSGEIEKL